MDTQPIYIELTVLIHIDQIKKRQSNYALLQILLLSPLLSLQLKIHQTAKSRNTKAQTILLY